MKSLRVVLCVVLGLLMLEAVFGPASADVPRTREIKDRIKWGDPDYPLARKGDPDTPWSVAGPYGMEQGENLHLQTLSVLPPLGVTVRVPVGPIGRPTRTGKVAE
jgi:hypothetical protein